MGRKESINERDPEVKRYMNSLCNVQKKKHTKNKTKKHKKIEQVKPKMMFLVFFYNVVLLAFCYCNNADLELYQNTWRLTEPHGTFKLKTCHKNFVVIVKLIVDGN